MMQEIKAIIRPERLTEVLKALHSMPDLPGVTTSKVRAYGRRYPLGSEPAFDQVERIKLEIVVPDSIAAEVVAAVERAAHTGHFGDGRIFASPVEHAVAIRTGEHEGRTPGP